MDRAGGHSKQPGWFTPTRLLMVFCAVNLMVYLDRGAIASNGINGTRGSVDEQGRRVGALGIQGELQLSNFQDGLLPAAFMVGLLVAAPTFAEACKHANAFRLIGVGMGVWTLAVLGCSVSYSLLPLLLCRMLVGVGEASFIALAAPFIDDHAPPARKTLWFAAFYLCIPVGVALGYIYGGIMSSAHWRLAFVLEGLVMLPFVAFCFLSEPLHMHSDREHPTEVAGPANPKRLGGELVHDVRDVMRHRLFNLEVVGYTFYCAVMGAYSFWGPKAGAELYGITPEAADAHFGALTVLTGVVGVVAGGMLLDKIGSSVRNAFLLCAVSTLCAWLVVSAVFLLTSTFEQFLVGFAIGELFLFLLQAPIAAVVMWVVPPGLRPLAISLNTMYIHVFGDVPSPPLLGLLKDALSAGKDVAGSNKQWRPAMLIITLLLLPSAIAMFLAALLAPHSPDYRNLLREDVLRIADSPAAVEDGLVGGTGRNETLQQGQDWNSEEDDVLETGANVPLLQHHDFAAPTKA